MIDVSDEKINSEVQGLGGWLILIGIIVVITPTVALTMEVPNYYKLFATSWLLLFDTNSTGYYPVLGYFLLVEAIVTLAFMVANFYVIYLFFKKNKLFPKWFVYSSALNMLFLFLRVALYKLVLEYDLLTEDLFYSIVISFVLMLICIIYTLYSKRVRNTFVN